MDEVLAATQEVLLQAVKRLDAQTEFMREVRFRLQQMLVPADPNPFPRFHLFRKGHR